MWRCWMILALCATGISSISVEPQSISVNPPLESRPGASRQNGVIKRFACPVGFFRLKGYCYYLSAGEAPWREAYFHCKDRNATLAIPNKRGKDRMLRKYLMGDQFTKLERWIGGIFNWQRMDWEWGVTGEKVVFQSFGRQETEKSEKYAWQCIIMDPALKYKWGARSCMVPKHYICEAPAGRIVKKRRNGGDPSAPQNQRLKPERKRKKYSGKKTQKTERQEKPRSSFGRRKNWSQQGGDHHWANGVNLGSRPPVNNRMYGQPRMRHHSNRTHPGYSAQRVAHNYPVTVTKGREYSAFLGDGPSNNKPQGLTDANSILSQYHPSINDFAREEVLLKP